MRREPAPAALNTLAGPDAERRRLDTLVGIAPGPNSPQRGKTHKDLHSAKIVEVERT
ncbi:MAG: hypothetical protein WC718_11985 [Phycisphaerales bacterium]